MPATPPRKPLLERPVHPWIQGLLLGVSVGAAFIVGWGLAKSGYDLREDALSPSTVHAAPPSVFSFSTDSQPVAIAGSVDEFFSPQPAQRVPADSSSPAAMPSLSSVPQPSVFAVNATVTSQDAEDLDFDAIEADLPDAASPAPEQPKNGTSSAAAAEASPVPQPAGTTASLAPSEAAILESAVIELTTEPGVRVLLVKPAAPVAAEQRELLGVVDKRGKLLLKVPSTPGGGYGTLFLEHPDCLSLRRDFAHAAGRVTVLEVRMTPKPATLAVFATPASAEVFVDGVRRGNGVVTLGLSSRVKHTVEVRLAGAAPSRHEVTIQPGGTRIVRANLLPPAPPGGDILFLGAMRALVLRPGVAVLVDGKPVRLVDGLAQGVAPGRRKISIVFSAAGGAAKPSVLWERSAIVRGGFAISFDNGDAPDAIVRPLPGPTQPEATPPVAVSESVLAASVRLRITLIDGGRGVPLSKARVTFGGLEPPRLKDGTFLLPVGRAAPLTVSVPGCATEERNLHFTSAGDRFITFILRAAPKTPQGEWRATVKAASKEDAILILSNTTEHTLAPGQTIALVPARAGADLLRLSILQVGGGNVVCQVLSGQGAFPLPEAGTPVTARFVEVSVSALP